MSKKVMFLTAATVITVVLTYSLSPLIRDSYVTWSQSEATRQHSKPKIFKTSIPASGSEAKISFKAVAFNSITFQIVIDSFSDENFRNLTKGRSGEVVIYLNFKDADDFAFKNIGFSDPRRLVDDKGEVKAISFESTKDIDLELLDKIASVDISILEYQGKNLKE